MTPTSFDGLLASMFSEAMAMADIELRAIDVAIDGDGAATVRDLVKATGGDGFLGGDERVSAAAVLWCLLAGHGSAGLTGRAILFVLCEVLVVMFLPAAERARGGAPYGPDEGGSYSSAIRYCSSSRPRARRRRRSCSPWRRPTISGGSRSFWSASATSSTRLACPSTGSVGRREPRRSRPPSEGASTSTRMNRRTPSRTG